MARLAPPDIVTEMFGLYQFAGKSVSFVGPIMFAVATDSFHSQRVGMATILLFILAGLMLMFKIKSDSHGNPGNAP
jgi:UMF1 family MFS transporter